MSDVENELLRLLVHYPLGQISAFQRKQLTTVNSPFVKVATFEGGGDDMDAPIKRMLASSLANKSNDTESSTTGNQLCGVNSYNIGRPLVQMIHFVSSCMSEMHITFSAIVFWISDYFLVDLSTV